MDINDELKITWKEAIVAYFQILSEHSPGRTGGSHEISQY
jgi:hypothetical protein